MFRKTVPYGEAGFEGFIFALGATARRNYILRHIGTVLSTDLLFVFTISAASRNSSNFWLGTNHLELLHSFVLRALDGPGFGSLGGKISQEASQLFD